MEPRIDGLHHVTATTFGAREDLDFYTGILGLRLVKKTVNFDNPGVYHFYYGDEVGSPSTLMTTFPYRDMGVPVGRKGAGQLTVTSFSVPGGSLPFWRDRFSERGVAFQDQDPRFGAERITLSDPSGLTLELIEAPDDERTPWTGAGIDEGAAVQGVHSVTMTVRSSVPSRDFLSKVLGFEVAGESRSRVRLQAGTGGPGRLVEILEAPDALAAINGTGTVHHVAFAVPDADAQLEAQAELHRLGYPVTEVRDRQYFLSIYFREPGGVLYEIATRGPGFAVDEAVPDLGEGLMLPPWEEPNRNAIEANLPSVSSAPRP